MAKAIGRVTVTVDGTKLDNLPGTAINLGGVAREAVETDQGVHYAEMLKASGVTVTVPVTKDTPLEAIKGWVAATLLWEGDNGVKYTIKNAFTLDTLEVKDGKAEIKMAGDPAEKM
jgi:hypothetical protein